MAKGQKSKDQQLKTRRKNSTQATQTVEATKATKRAAIYIESFHHLPQEYIARFGEPEVVALDRQERTCRAYCERMGYSIFHVYKATTPPPDNVKPHVVLGTSLSLPPGDTTANWRFYQQYDSRHPYYWVRNLLEMGTVDVVVEFRERGPSGPMFSDLVESQPSGAEYLKQLTRYEYASLWEIEPPTENERLAYELAERIGKAEAETEQAELLEQLRRVVDEIKREKQAAEERAQQNREDALAEAQSLHYQVVINWDEEAHTYLARVPELPGCIAHGATYEEAACEAQVAIRLFQKVANVTTPDK